MELELIITALTGGIFSIIAILLLQRGWERKLALTIQAEEVKAQADVKIARIKQPTIKNRRMPKGYKDQIVELVALLGDERIQDLIGLFSEKQEDISNDNKLINTLIPVAQGFLANMNKDQSGSAETKQNLLFQN